MQEKWVNANGLEISGLIDSNGDLTNNAGSEHAAIINFSDNNNWEEENGYYYFKYVLKPGETTSTLTDSVTFNCNTNASQTCTKSQDGQHVICSTSGNGYDNATYTLTFKIDTIQYQNYDKVWGSNINISSSSYNSTNDNNGSNYNSSNTCLADNSEPITLNGEEFYILDDSHEEYTLLLKKNVLTTSEVNTCSTDYVSQAGEYPFYLDEDCDSETNNSFCIETYGQSSIREIVDCWAENFSNYIVEGDLYDNFGRYINKTGLVDSDIIFNNLCYERVHVPTYTSIDKGENVPSLAIVDGKGYWSELSGSYSEGKVYVIRNGEKIYPDNVYNKHFIRPVIKAKKCVVTNTCE